MPKTINGIGLGCGEPLIMAKKGLEEENEITILVDERPALENLKAFAAHAGCTALVTGEPGGAWAVRLIKPG